MTLFVDQGEKMVLYYSATGNTEYVAKEIAKYIDDEVLNLLTRIREHDYSVIRSEKPFVICSPIHVCEMPLFFARFLENLELAGNRNVYFVFTSGGYAGIAGALARKTVERKGMIYRGRAEFKMPRNYPISRHYPLQSAEENNERIDRTRDRIPEAAEKIKNGERLRSRRITYLEMLITLPFTPVWAKYKHTARPFRSTDKCIGCGKCAMVCPLNNITIRNRRPEWADECSHCMACYANCPVEAIEYGDITIGKNRHRFGK